MIPVSEVGLVAEAHGAPVWGAAAAADLPVDREEIERILPGARTVIVLGSPHSRSAIASTNIQVAQYDTIHTYDGVAQASHTVALWLERKGYGAVAVPAFIPIDMSPPNFGMRGAVDWRRAGVAAGIGGYGESGLLVTKAFGPAVRLGGVVTDAKSPPARRFRSGIGWIRDIRKGATVSRNPLIFMVAGPGFHLEHSGYECGLNSCFR